MEVWLQGAISDVHTADARYHIDYRTKFMAPRSVLTAQEVLNTCLDIQRGIKTVQGQWWSYSFKCAQVQQLSELLGKELVVLSAIGLANILAFRENVHDVLQVEDEVSIGKVEKQIIKESKRYLQIKRHTILELIMAANEVSYTLKCHTL